MANTIAAFFRTRAEGEAARKQLLASGFSESDVSFVAADNQNAEPVAREQSPVSPGQSDPEPFLEDVIGVAVEAYSLLVPGTGPLVAAGPLAAAIGQKAGGSDHERIMETLRDHGVSEKQAAYYSEGIHTGGALVMVHAIPGGDGATAARILVACGAVTSEEIE